MKHTSAFLRIAALMLSLLLLVASLSACGASKDPASPDKTSVVGSVDGRDVYYDELYFLVNRYLPTAKENVGEDPATLSTELDRLFRENVVNTYAMLRLCETRGLVYREKDFDDRIDQEIEYEIGDYYNGDKKAYNEDMEQLGLSARYNRFLIGTGMLYSELLTVYPEQGLVQTDEAAIRSIIEREFIHVYHLAIFNDEGDDASANLIRITHAQEMLASGEKTMYQLIKEGYSEDFSDPAAHGEYIIRGTMDELYEKAAFSLGVGDVSGVVKSQGINNSNQTVPCYYVIQRFDHVDSYVEEHFAELQEEYYSSVISSDLEEVKKELTFEPNELYGALRLNELPKPKTTSPAALILLSAVGVLAVLAAVIVPVILLKKKHAKKNVGYSLKKKT